jgi:hypothetical protein
MRDRVEGPASLYGVLGEAVPVTVAAGETMYTAQKETIDRDQEDLFEVMAPVDLA